MLINMPIVQRLSEGPIFSVIIFFEREREFLKGKRVLHLATPPGA